MEKQKKVLNKINRKTAEDAYKNLQDAKKAKNDEMYTPSQFIADELCHWMDKFKGKRVICPCDWDIFENEEVYSMTIEFSSNPTENIWGDMIYKINSVKYYTEDLFSTQQEEKIITGKEAEDLIKNRVTCNFIRYLKEIGQRVGIKSITASGYNPETGRGTPFQDVDYSQYDICVTNPPFSLYTEFMNTLMPEVRARKNTDNPFDFIVLAPFLNRYTPNVGLPLMLKEIYLGYGRHVGCAFINPTKNNSFKTKSVACDWLTTFDDAQKEVDKTRMFTNINYEMYKDDYYEMENMTMKDGTHPIKVTGDSVPDDYKGWMFGPINLLDKISYDEFEWYGLGFCKFFNNEHPELNPFIHKVGGRILYHNNKQIFGGIVFRRKI